MKTCLLIILIFFIPKAQAEFDSLDRYCSKQIDQLRLFYVNGMFTSSDDFRKNLAWLDNFQMTKLGKYLKGREPTGSYNKDEDLHMQIYEVAKQKYGDLSPFSNKYHLITAILGGTVDSLSQENIAHIESVIEEVFSSVTYSKLNDTDYRNAYQKLLFQMHSCNRIILIGHSQGNFYTNALFEETISTYQYSDGYLASDYPLVGLAAIATPTSSIGGSLGEEYKEIISHLTLDEDWFMRAVRILFGSLPSNYSAESLFDSTGHGLIDAYLRNNAVANAISAKIEFSIQNQTPFPLFEQHPVNSDAFSHIGYSTINKVLDLKFESGGVYRYYNIPILLWDKLYYSTSMGKVFNDNIRGQYPFNKLDIESMTYLKMTSLEPVAKVEK
ncbi:MULTISPECIES: KTSC domain-containing protein [unclassified Pseudoalteromonas]|uniref:KTSC domain-containing protein n=1 Tax=unclassified Pseudoalteromonas TaxID=194690 RepID=UPI000B3D3877|nr:MULTISPECIES: KTSC domain-containing protein [unclassified Pseudoalteromonas]MDN3380755.1 KTSC domain-containing protein [Pseudoalteromonas sp. APC 3893]MDN3389141.1 KTSC domain-containing protein [Pseudoalteromonas sp. APC 4017]OUS72023.1 KTSC domain-containing protein [Pseudoalteromonas sp. A601]